MLAIDAEVVQDVLESGPWTKEKLYVLQCGSPSIGLYENDQQERGTIHTNSQCRTLRHYSNPRRACRLNSISAPPLTMIR